MRAWFTADGTAEDRVAALASVLRKGATFGPGLVNQAFSFDGIDDLVEVPHDPRLAPAQVSVEAWIRLDTLDSPGDGSRQLTLVSRRNPVSGSGYELAKTADDAFVFTIASAASEAFAAPSVTRAVPGRFHHLAGTFDGRAVRLYVDGVLESQVPADVIVDSGVAPLLLGANGAPTSPRTMKGVLDEVTIYEGALTDEEVRVIHAAGASGKCRELTILPPALPGADLGVPYVADVAVTPSPEFFTYRLAGGMLPAGITLGEGGALSGTPDEVGAFDFTVEARGDAGGAASHAFTLDVFACPVPPQAIVAWYRGEGTARDRAGANHGIPESEGTVTFPPGRVGRAFGLESLGVPVPDAPALNPIDVLTLAAWVFPTATSGGPGDPVGTIIVKEGFVAPDLVTQYAIGRRNDVACGSGTGIPTGNFAFVLGGRETVVNDILIWQSNLPDDCSGWVDGRAQLPLDTWSHVALTFDRDGGLARAYVNGVITREVAASDPLPVTTGRLHIGSRGGRAHWTGLIDEAMVFAQQLGPAEITAMIESLDVEACAGAPNRAPRLTAPAPQSSAVLDIITLPLLARDPDLDTLQWRANGLPPNLGIDPATGVVSGTLAASAAGQYTPVIFVSDGLAETSGSFGWTVRAGLTSISDVSVNRSTTATTTATFTVALAPALTTGSATVAFATVDGTARAGADYVSTSGTLTFVPGQTAANIHVTVPAGAAPLSDATFFVHLSDGIGAHLGRARATGTILQGQNAEPVSIEIAEAIAMSDSPGIVGPVAVALSELVGMNDAVTALPPAVVSLTEVVGFSDTPAAVPPVTMSLTEPVAIGDTPGAVPPATVSLAEPVVIGDTPGAVPSATVSLTEAVAIGDTPGAVPPATVALAEPLAIGDTPGAVPAATVSIAEPVAIGDIPGAVPPAVVLVAEPVSIGDVPSAVPPNRPPTADAGADQLVATGATVTLDGSRSSDPDESTTLQFFWSLLSKPAGSAAALTSEQVPAPTFVADRDGDYVARLVVSDGVVSSAPDTVVITVRDGADVRVAFHPPSTSTAPPVGSLAEFFLIVNNGGPAGTDGVSVQVPLPAGYGPPSIAEILGTYDPGTGRWNIGPLPVGLEAHLHLRATVQPSGSYDVTASITAADRPDPNLANNTATALVTPNPDADVRVAFHPPSTSTSPPVGSLAEFFVIVTNGGPATTDGVAAQVMLPAGYGPPSVAEILGAYDPATGRWAIGALRAGQEAHLHLRATVQPSGPYDVTAAITTSDQPDPNAANNAATAIVTPEGTSVALEDGHNLPPAAVQTPHEPRRIQ